MELERHTLEAAVKQLGKLSKTGSVACKALQELLSQLLHWVNTCADTSTTSSSSGQTFNEDQNVWDGVEALELFETHLSLSLETLEIYQQHFNTLVEQQVGMIHCCVVCPSS